MFVQSLSSIHSILWQSVEQSAITFEKSTQVHVIFINIRKPEKIVHLWRLAVCPGCIVSKRVPLKLEKARKYTDCKDCKSSFI